MSTAQQLGLIGNSIKVQSLPTASAETFGAGNRFYTLIGQQEGYITGHTYRTVVANDVYSWEDVAGGNYNLLDNIPVINQDLSASGFTPVANTYYRHTDATTDTFIQGVIYLYDTAYHKLGESGGGGGGTTLNKYTFSGTSASRLNRILTNAKSISAVSLNGLNVAIANMPADTNSAEFYAISYAGTSIEIRSYKIQSSSKFVSYAQIKTDGTVTVTVNESASFDIVIEYWNDTEIT